MVTASRHTVRVVDRTIVGVKFCLLTLELVNPNSNITFSPGHYLSLKIHEQKRNPYSICSLPQELPRITLCVDIAPQGEGARFISHAPLGTQTDVLIPLGKFLLSENHQKPSLFVATGSGISPLRPMITTRLQANSQAQVHLYWGLRNEENIFWADWLEGLKEQYLGFAYQLCLSRPTQPDAFCGHVTDFLKEKPWVGYEVYLCGNKGMITDGKALLQVQEISETDVYTEQFF